MTVRQWIEDASTLLAEAGVESFRLEAQVLAAAAIGVDRTWLLAHAEDAFDSLTAGELLQRRLHQEPLAYIVGVREFYGRPFRVTPAVLIPRQDTETLVETALRYPARSVLDIGTGSGNIAITLKLERPDSEVTAIDVSSNALEVACANARALGAAVRFELSDAFEVLNGESFDLIVSNPPYIGVEEPLAREVVEFEPHLALFASDEGMAFYRRLAREAMNYLNDGGMLMVEVGYRQSELVRECFVREGWQHLETVRDLAGISRVAVFGWEFQCAMP